MLGSDELDEEVMHKLIRTIESRDAHERTVATLTLLKLCNSKVSSSFVYVVDHGQLIRPEDSGVLLREEGLGHLFEAVGAGGDLAAGSVCVDDVFEAK